MKRDDKLDLAIDDSWEEHSKLIENVLLDPDQSTLHAHLLDLKRWRDRGREFTSEERRDIRRLLEPRE